MFAAGDEDELELATVRRQPGENCLCLIQVFPRQRGESMLDFFMPKSKFSNTRNEERKAEIRIIREFADKLIREGKAKEFLVENGFVKQTGGLTKRYGG